MKISDFQTWLRSTRQVIEYRFTVGILGNGNYRFENLPLPLYHCLLAILWRYGYESRNQACTFAAIEKLIAEGKVNITIEELQSIQEGGGNHDETVVDLREYYQYGTETQVETGKIILLQQQAKEFVAKVRALLEEGNEK